jgi:transcriptional regulator with XRE-family HTH domain
MKTHSGLQAILKRGKLSNELDLERALQLDRKLRLMVREHPELIEARKQLRLIIKDYENSNWKSSSKITDQKIIESDVAELIVEQERLFIAHRKELIKKRMDKYSLSQQDLGKLLGHGKTYMSELINGVNPFSIRDSIIVHRLFHIKLEYLIPTTISEKEMVRLKETITNLDKPKLKLEKVDLVYAVE